MQPEYVVFLCTQCMLEPGCVRACVCVWVWVCRGKRFQTYVCLCFWVGYESGCMAFAGLCVTVSLCVQCLLCICASLWCVCLCVLGGVDRASSLGDVCVTLFGVCLWVVVALGGLYKLR